MRNTVVKNALGLLAWLAACFAAAAVGSLASIGSGSFYSELARPAWAPPAWLFGPAWTVLYLLMGIAAWMVWKEKGWRIAGGALALFIIQLPVNALWTWLFFSWKLGAVSFVEILGLLVLIIFTMLAFWRERTLAGLLMVPYVVWVTYATALTYAVWRLNPALLG